MMLHTTAAPTSNDVWSRLTAVYQATDSSHKMSATKAFHSLMMKEGEPIEKYVQTFRSARARLAACGTNLSETDAAKAFLASLPPSYNAFTTTQTGLLDQGKATVAAGGGKNITLADVIASLLAEELRRDSHKCRSGSTSNNARALYASKPKFRKGKKSYSNLQARKLPKRKGLATGVT